MCWTHVLHTSTEQSASENIILYIDRSNTREREKGKEDESGWEKTLSKRLLFMCISNKQFCFRTECKNPLRLNNEPESIIDSYFYIHFSCYALESWDPRHTYNTNNVNDGTHTNTHHNIEFCLCIVQSNWQNKQIVFISCAFSDADVVFSSLILFPSSSQFQYTFMLSNDTTPRLRIMSYKFHNMQCRCTNSHQITLRNQR